MADLAHSMENLLDKIRQGEQDITTEVADALLHALDGLNELRKELVSPDAEETVIGPYVAELAGVTIADASVASSGDAQPATLTLDEDSRARLAALLVESVPVVRVVTELDAASQWPSVRCFQMLSELTQLGEVVASAPTMAQIEAGATGTVLTAILATSLSQHEILTVVQEIEEVSSATIAPYLPEPDADGASEAQEGTPKRGAKDDGGPGQPTNGAKASPARTARIDVERLDDLMNALGELVVDKTRIAQIARTFESRYRGDDLVESLSLAAARVVKVVDY
jgi:two-component system chemotaxis sensor kinase CheA